MNSSVDEAESIKLLVELFNKGKSHCMVLSSMCRKSKAKKQTTTKKKERKKDKQKNTENRYLTHDKRYNLIGWIVYCECNTSAYI